MGNGRSKFFSTYSVVKIIQLTSILHVRHESGGDESRDKESDDDESGEVPQLPEPAALLREVDDVDWVLSRSIHIWGGRERNGGTVSDVSITAHACPSSLLGMRYSPVPCPLTPEWNQSE